jgi:hypothetical protein
VFGFASLGHNDAMNKRTVVLVLGLAGLASANVMHAWGPQGHRLVALIAANHLTPEAKRQVDSLLGGEPLDAVASWADAYLSGVVQTARWHYVNIPTSLDSYDRDRDCPRQPGVEPGSRNDRWRDCAIDRILYSQERLADPRLDRADRAVALKFLVHFVGDLHQPLHAVDTAAGGNGITVTAFGSANCSYDDGTTFRCNLHNIWDEELIEHRGWTDARWIEALERRISDRQMAARPVGTPTEWAMESHDLAREFLTANQREIDDAYYAKYIGSIEERLAYGGVRLAAAFNEALASQ